MYNVCIYTIYTRYLTMIQVVEAARQGAQIILLPEDGIHGYGQLTRETLRGGNGERVVIISSPHFFNFQTLPGVCPSCGGPLGAVFRGRAGGRLHQQEAELPRRREPDLRGGKLRQRGAGLRPLRRWRHGARRGVFLQHAGGVQQHRGAGRSLPQVQPLDLGAGQVRH